MFLNVVVPCDARDYLYHGKTLLHMEKKKVNDRFCNIVMSISPSAWMSHKQVFYSRVMSQFPELSPPEMTLIWTIQNFIRLVFINNYHLDIRITDAKVIETLGCISIKIGYPKPQRTGTLP